MSIDVMKQALETLEECTAYTSSESWSPSMTRECEAAITALRERLAQPEQEPVAWISESENLLSWDKFYDHMTPLYTAPRQWQGLTADEIWACNVAPAGHSVTYHISMANQNVLDFAEAIEAKLKEKNT